MPEWLVRILLVGGAMAILAGGSWMLRRMQGAAEPGVVKGSPHAAGGAAVAFVSALGFCLVGIFLSDLSAPGQIVPWLLLVGSFALAGAALMFFCTGTLAQYDTEIVVFRTWNREVLVAPWTDVRKVRLDFWKSGVVFEFRSGGKASLPGDAGGLLELIRTAAEVGAPGAADMLGGGGTRA